MDNLCTLSRNMIEGFGLQQQQQKLGLITAAIATTTVITSYGLYKIMFQDIYNDGCPVVPVNGSSEDYSRDPRAFTEKWTEKLGLVYRAHVFGRMHTIVSGKYVREIFMNNNFDFIIGIRKKFDLFLLAGIPDDEVTVEILRKVIVQHLTPNMKRFTPRVVENLCIGLDEVLGDVIDGSHELESLFPLVQRMVTKASASVFVGEKMCKNKEVINILQTMQTDLSTFHPRYNPNWLTEFPWLNKLRMRAIGNYSSKVRYYRQTLLDALTTEINLRQSKGNNDPHWKRPDDILQELIEHADPPSYQDMYTFILNQLLLLTFVSIQTTTENGTIVLYRLLQNPQLLKELLEEQKYVLEQEQQDQQKTSQQKGSTDTKNSTASEIFTADTIKKMVKLDSVCREILRLRSRFYELSHTNVSDHNIVLSNGTVIPPDGDVLINIWYNHHSGNDDLEEFKPFRYVDSGYPSTKVGDNYLLFGEGKHACPGRWFAMQQIKTIVSLLIRDYDLCAADEVVIPTTDVGLPYGKVTIAKRQ